MNSESLLCPKTIDTIVLAFCLLFETTTTTILDIYIIYGILVVGAVVLLHPIFIFGVFKIAIIMIIFNPKFFESIYHIPWHVRIVVWFLY